MPPACWTEWCIEKWEEIHIDRHRRTRQGSRRQVPCLEVHLRYVSSQCTLQYRDLEVIAGDNEIESSYAHVKLHLSCESGRGLCR